MENLAINRQWSTRPNNERFLDLNAMANHFARVHSNSRAKVVSSRSLTVEPVAGDHKALVVAGPDGSPVNVTNWAFGQLAQRAGSPAGYLRQLPAPLAADCLNYGLHCSRDVEDIGVLLYRNGGPLPELKAVTGPNYGRIWNSEVVNALVHRFGDGRTGQWRVPGEFGRDVAITERNTTLYASDRDMFVFLCDERNRIELPNRRDGKTGTLARGFYVWNSDVGSATLGIAGFLFDYMCSNRIAWGVQNFEQKTIRHTASAPDKWIEAIQPALKAYAESTESGTVNLLQAAQKAKIDKVDEFLAKRFTKSQVTSIKSAHIADENRPIETLWDAATGVTAYARSIQWQDERVTIEREAGKILDLATA